MVHLSTSWQTNFNVCIALHSSINSCLGTAIISTTDGGEGSHSGFPPIRKIRKILRTFPVGEKRGFSARIRKKIQITYQGNLTTHSGFPPIRKIRKNFRTLGILISVLNWCFCKHYPNVKLSQNPVHCMCNSCHYQYRIQGRARDTPPSTVKIVTKIMTIEHGSIDFMFVAPPHLAAGSGTTHTLSSM